MTRADIKLLDPPLYQALAVWMHRHPEETLADMHSPMQEIMRQIDEYYDRRRQSIAPRNRRRK
ncbi:hypothetical protein W911_03500 [Hyphomicrobium nitrativorans NL23]|uniref:Uncharacterized protein n=2 Tax=Hyphomicrobium TaxID=81 RepID=V5SIX8_9HYPH|nr:hypothetical protein W911_03500 [Hyphomicrobium nitrativorans NL23]